MRFTQYFLEGEIFGGLFKKLQSANAPIQYMVRQSTSRKSRSSWHRALRLSQPTDSVKKDSFSQHQGFSVTSGSRQPGKAHGRCNVFIGEDVIHG
jgi:hypothetical protein